MCHFKYSHEHSVPGEEAGATAKAKAWLRLSVPPTKAQGGFTPLSHVQAAQAVTLTPEHNLTESIAGIKNLHCKA